MICEHLSHGLILERASHCWPMIRANGVRILRNDLVEPADTPKMFPKSSRNVLRVADSELAELKRTDLERCDWAEDGPQMFRISRENRHDMRTASGSNPPGKDLRACN
jgi:hypothetical protein